MESTSLLFNLVLALGIGLFGALLAARIGQSVILGYILGGIAISRYTPGFVGHEITVNALADIGIILLMFAIGVQFSLAELLRSGKVASLGAGLQVVIMIGVGYGVGQLLGWGSMESLFFGAVISNSSSTVLSKVAGENGEIDAPHSRMALSWSTVQDLSTVILIVLLSALATDSENLALDLVREVGKVAIFLLLLIPFGLKVLPRIFEWIVALRSREIFVLSVAVAALGLAYSASFFGLSLALGAFVAGIVVGESDLSHQILGEILPLRDIFAGLFFVSVGMVVDPAFVIRNIPLVLLTLGLIILVKGVLTAVISAWMKTPIRTTILSAALLAQCAEFSFLMARVGTEVGAVGQTAFSLMLAASAASIVLAPTTYRLSKPLASVAADRMPAAGTGVLIAPEHATDQSLSGHAIICGYGRVGRVIAEALQRHGFRSVVIEEDSRLAKRAMADGIPIVQGSAAIPAVFEQTNPTRARVLVIAIPDPVASRMLVDHVKDRYPRLDVVVRTHNEDERRDLLNRGVDEVVLGEWELALEMTRHALHQFGLEALITGQIVQRLRSRVDPETTEDAIPLRIRDRISLYSELRRQTAERRAERPRDGTRSKRAEPGPRDGRANGAAGPRPARTPRIKRLRPSGEADPTPS